jgi:hypothetical protein
LKPSQVGANGAARYTTLAISRLQGGIELTGISPTTHQIKTDYQQYPKNHRALSVAKWEQKLTAQS